MSDVTASSRISPWGFRRYWTATTISGFGDWVSIVALSFALIERNGIVLLGAALFARQIAVVVMLLAGGLLADRFRRWVLIGASFLVRAVCQVVLAVLILDGARLVAAILIVQFVNGAATAFSRPASSGLIPQLVPDRSQLQKANSWLSLSRSTVGLLGAAGGAVIVVAVTASVGLLVDAATFLIAFALIFRLAATAPNAKAPGSPLADLREGAAAAVRFRWFLPVVATFTLSNLLYSPALAVLGPAVSLRHYDGAVGWSAVLIAEALGGIGGAWLGTRLSFRRPLAIGVALPLIAVLELVLLALAVPLAALVVAAVLAGASLTLSDALWHGVLQSSVPDHLIGRLSSIDWFGSVALAPLGYGLIPVIAHAAGTEPVLLVSAAALTVGTLAVVLFGRLGDASRYAATG
jgi:MFS family permease